MKISATLAYFILLPSLGFCNANHNNVKDTTTKSNPETVLFAPGMVPGVSNLVAAPAFAPDGKSVYFGQTRGSNHITIVTSYLKDGSWTSPVTAPFSGDYPNLEPAFDPHGKYLIFASSRPATPGDSLINGNWNGKEYPGKGGNLWKVSYSKNRWGEPARLPEVINRNGSVFSPAVAADGSLYFMRADSGGVFHIYRSQYKNGQYQTPVRASFCIGKYGDYDPAVAPDESFLIFSSPRPPAQKSTDLFIVFRTPAGWSDPIDLRQAVSDKVFGVEARLSPDLKMLYFTNQINKDGFKVPTDTYIWQVNITTLLMEHWGLR
jgi:Tol biopolymer transport system component